MTLLLILFVVFNAIFIWIGKDLRLAQELFYEVAGSALLIAGLLFFNRKPIKTNKVSLWIGIFAIYSIILFLLSGCRLGETTMLNIFMGCLLYYYTLQVPKEDTHLILKSIIMICVLNGVYMALQMVNFDPIFVIRGNHDTIANTIDLIAMFGLKAVMGMFMALGAIATLFVNPWLSIAFIYPLYVARATGAIAGAGIGALFYFWWVKRKIFWILMPIFLLGTIGYYVFVDNPMQQSTPRFGVWKMAVKDTVYGFDLKSPKLQSPFLHNIITGFGLDAFFRGTIVYFNKPLTTECIRGIRTPNGLFGIDGRQFRQNEYNEILSPDGQLLDRWDNPHNLIVSIFYDWGLIGLVICGFLLFYLKERFKNAIKSRELVNVTALIIVLLISSLTQFPMFLGRIGYLMPIFLGLFIVNSEG